jgi:hypothetical protein
MISAEKFKRQTLPRQFGALAANLARISSVARWPEPSDVLLPMLTESIYFAEWMLPQVEPETVANLVDLQVMLGLWRKSWPRAKEDRTQRTLLSFQAKKWSDQVLDYSDLLQA